MSLGARYNIAALAATRALLAALDAGTSTRCVLAFGGDSWAHGDTYWLRQFTRALQTKYGFGGIGWVGFQWFGTTSGTWVDGGSQPSGGGAGSSRGDLVAAPVFNGAWTSDNGSGGLATPSLGNVTSTAANAYVRFAFPAGHTGADLYYAGDGTGVVQYSWDGGSNWSANLELTGVGPSHIALADVPTGSGTLRIRVVSGNVNLVGVNLISTADGVVVHKLGASGANSTMWSSGNLATWAAQVDSLGVNLFGCILGTNDQNTPLATSTFAANIAAFMGALATQNADIERLWIGPAENTGGRATPMTAYNAAAKEVAASQGFAHYDLEKLFGPDPDDYANGTSLSLLDASGGHPSTTRGGAMIANAIERLLAPVH